MDIGQMISDYEARAVTAGLSINEVCRAAGFHPATFYRWKRGDSTPTVRLLQKLDHALTAVEAEGAA